MVTFDEFHHMGKELSWGTACQAVSARKYQTKPERDTIPDRWPGNTLSGVRR